MKIFKNKVWITDKKYPQGQHITISDNCDAAKKIEQGFDFEIDWEKGQVIIKKNKIK